MSYAGRTRRPPRTMTDGEVKLLLRASGAAVAGFRDHVLLSLALGCGLREFEIVALDLVDVLTPVGNVRKVIQLRTFKGSERAGARAGTTNLQGQQRVHVPDATFYKLEKFLRRRRRGRRDVPLFVSRKGNRLSTRAVRAMFAKWQGAAGLSARYHFHELRHTAVTIVRRRTRDLRITQRFARHVSIETTMRYEHAADEELRAAVAGLDV